MKLQFSPKELETYFSEQYKTPFKEEAVTAAENITIHADGLYPKKLLDERRPHEHPEVQAYRQKIFVSKTKGYFGKILTSLNKIRRSSDWGVKYTTEEFPRIAEGETLEDYCETKFPITKKFEHWVFRILLRHFLIDPNGVVFWLPQEVVVESNAYLKPVPYIFESAKVVAYEEGDFCVLVDPDAATFTEGGIDKDGDLYYVVTTQNVYTYAQVDSKRRFELVGDYQHNLGILPAFKIGAAVVDVKKGAILYESRIAACIPHWDEAVREYSDIQAAIVLHIFPERWEYAQADCPTCKGTGRLSSASGTVACTECSGIGKAPSPYQNLIVTANEAGMEAPPTPPAGYIQKDVEIVKLQDQRIVNHIYEGLSAVNMEFLMKTPLNESGLAKEVDRDELNTFVYTVAEDIILCMEKSYKIMAQYRYGGLYSQEELEAMMPEINVPVKFDMLSANYLEQELKDAKDGDFNANLVGYMETMYASKKFPDNPNVAKMMELTMNLDPQFGVTEETKISRRQNGGISEEVYILSSNIHNFLQRAVEENERFISMSRAEQLEILMGYVEEIRAEEEAARAEEKAAEVERLMLQVQANGGQQNPQQQQQQQQQEEPVDA